MDRSDESAGDFGPDFGSGVMTEVTRNDPETTRSSHGRLTPWPTTADASPLAAARAAVVAARRRLESSEVSQFHVREGARRLVQVAEQLLLGIEERRYGRVERNGASAQEDDAEDVQDD